LPPFRAQWVIEPEARMGRLDKPVEPPSRGRRVGRRRSAFRRQVEHCCDWLHRWRAVLSLAAIALLAATFVYFRQVNWQPPWQLPESSDFVKWFGRGGGGGNGGGAAGAIPDRPKGF
jgi:hypothetical protein